MYSLIKKPQVIFMVSSILFCSISSAKEIKQEVKELSPFYVRADAGISIPSRKLSSGEVYYNQRLIRSELYGFGVGYILNDNLRTDITFTGRTNYKFSYNGNDEDELISVNQDIGSNTLMANLYYSAVSHNIFSPYINIGLGVSKISLKNYYGFYKGFGEDNLGDEYIHTSSSNNSYNFAWNIGLGAQIKLNDNLSCDTFFRFIDMGRTKTQFIDIYEKNGNYTNVDTVSPFLLQSFETGISLLYRF